MAEPVDVEGDPPLLSSDGLVLAMVPAQPAATGGGPAPRRRRPGLGYLALAVAALLVVAASALLMHRAETDRRAALAARDQAQSDLAEQRREADATHLHASLDRDVARAFATAVSGVRPQTQQVQQLATQQLPTLQSLQVTGEHSQSAAYNRLVDQANATATQLTDALRELLRQIAALPGP